MAKDTTRADWKAKPTDRPENPPKQSERKSERARSPQNRLAHFRHMQIYSVGVESVLSHPKVIDPLGANAESENFRVNCVPLAIVF